MNKHFFISIIAFLLVILALYGLVHLYQNSVRGLVAQSTTQENQSEDTISNSEVITCSATITQYTNDAFTIPCPQGAVIIKDLDPDNRNITIDLAAYRKDGITHTAYMWIDVTRMVAAKDMADFRNWFHWSARNGLPVVTGVPKDTCYPNEGCMPTIGAMLYKESTLNGHPTISYEERGVSGGDVHLYMLIPEQGEVYGTIYEIGYHYAPNGTDEIEKMYQQILASGEFRQY